MKLISCHVNNFGCLHAFSCSFSDGLTVFCKENGWGKSTLCAFLRVMFYGFSGERKKGATTKERTLYTPWQGGTYGGSVTFSTETGTWRIERTFGKREKEDLFVLYDVQTRQPSTVYSSNIGLELFGVDAAAFARSAFSPQNTTLPSGTEGIGEIRAALAKLIDDVCDMSQYDRAMAALEKEQKEYKKTGDRGLLPIITEEIAALEREREACLVAAAEEKKAIEQADAYGCRLEQIRASEKVCAQAREERELQKRAQTVREWTAAQRKNKQELAQAEAFFDGNLPDSEQCKRIEERLLAAKQLDAAYTATKTSAADRARADDILNQFTAKAFPQKECFEQCFRRAQRAEECRAQLAILHTADKQNEHFCALAETFASGVPTKADFDAVYESANAFEGAKQRLKDLQKEADKIAPSTHFSDRQTDKPRFLPLAVSALAVLGSAVALVWGILFRNLPLSAVAAILLAVAAIGTCLGLAKRKRIRKTLTLLQTQMAALREQAKNESQKIRLFFDTYGIKIEGTDSANATQAYLRRLEKEAEQYRQLQTERAQREEQQKNCEAQLAALQKESILALALQNPNAPVTEHAFLQALHDDCQFARTVEEKTQKAHLLHLDRKNAHTEVCNFLRQWYPDQDTRPDSELLKELQERADSVRHLRKQIALADISEKSALENDPLLRAYLEAHPEPTASDEKQAQLPQKEQEEREEQEEQKESERLRKEREACIAARVNAQSIAKIAAEKAGNLPQIEMNLQSLRERKAEYEKRLYAAQKARELLEKAKNTLSTRYLQKMENSIAALMHALCNEDVSCELDQDLSISYLVDGKNRGIGNFSRGWQDISGFCLRLALCDAVFSNEKPPLFLDDPFVNLDDTRQKNARALLDTLAQDRQILYFCCSQAREPIQNDSSV